MLPDDSVGKLFFGGLKARLFIVVAFPEYDLVDNVLSGRIEPLVR